MAVTSKIIIFVGLAVSQRSLKYIANEVHGSSGTKSVFGCAVALTL